MTSKKKKVQTERVTSTIPKSVVDTWRQVAKIEGRSLSKLIAEWMTELEPGLQDILRMRVAWEAADADQREAMRSAVTVAGDEAQQAMLTSWSTVTSAIESTHVE